MRLLALYSRYLLIPAVSSALQLLVIILMLRRNLLTVKHVALATLIIVGAIVPWTLYQKFYDPPGDRLVKMHLAGVIGPDSRGTFAAIREAYTQISGKTIFENKWRNLETLVLGERFAWRSVRIAEREYIPEAIGVLNLGWLAALAICVMRRRAQLPYAGAMICAALLNLLVWCLLLFGPGQAFTAHASYADILLLSIACVSFALMVPGLATAMLVLQVINLFFVWVPFRPNAFILPTRMVVAPALQWPMLTLAVCFGGVLFLAAALPHAFFQKQTE